MGMVQWRGEEMGRGAGTFYRTHLTYILFLQSASLALIWTFPSSTKLRALLITMMQGTSSKTGWVAFFSHSRLSSKYQMMRTAGAACELMGQHRNEYPCNTAVVSQNHVIQHALNRIKWNSEGREKCWHFAKICSHFHWDLEISMAIQTEKVSINQVNKNVIVFFPVSYHIYWRRICCDRL